MKKHARWVAFAMVLCLVLLAAGCRQLQVEGIKYQKVDKSTLSFELDGATWTRSVAGRTATIYRQNQAVATVAGQTAQVTLSDGRVLTVELDRQGKPVRSQVAFGAQITQEDNTLAASAMEVNRLGIQVMGNPAGAIIWMVIMLALGVLAAIFNKPLAQLLGGSTFDGGRRARKIVWAAVGLLILVGLIILLALVL